MPILNLLKNMRRLRKAEELSVEQVRSLRESRFKSLLKHALQKSKFYQRS
jgi:phenylacetate-coenzyme A ligase PaaK-like adenylate-forming protein